MANPGDPPMIQDMGPSERMRVTRELHDIEQSLAILGVQMMRAGNAVSGLPGALHPGIPELSGKLKEVGERVGRLSRELHSSRLKSFNLADAIQKYVEDSSKQFHIPVASRCQSVPADLDSLLALGVLRVIQEAIDNAGKHSRAKQIRVEVQGLRAEIQLQVIDDGIGFDVEEAPLAAGLGLVSMRERIRLAGGQFTLVSKPGEGTRISATVPLDQETSASTA